MGIASRRICQGGWAKCLLALALVAGILVAGYIAHNLWSRIRGLDSAQRDHAEWVYSQLEVEYLKLDRALDAARSGTPEALEGLRKRFDVFYSRVDIAQRVKTVGVTTPEIDDLRRVLDAQIPLIDADDATLLAALDRLEAALDLMEAAPREIALSSISRAAQESEAERENIVRLLEVMFVIVLLFTAALSGAILRLSRQTGVLNRASRALERNSQRLETTLRASLDAVVVVDKDGVIRDFNGSAEAIFGFPRKAAMGRDYAGLLVPEHLRDELRASFARFRATGASRFAEAGRQDYEMQDHEGRVFPVEISVSLTRSSDEPMFVAYIRDITDKRQKEQELVRARDEALDAYREKSRFFAMMSHEMRTPLNGVLSALHLLGDGRLDAEQQHFLESALASGDILLNHINDVLAIERSEAETEDQALQPCDMAALTAGLLGSMQPLARTSGTRLHLDQSRLTDRPVMTDPRAVQQILVNLLSNAIKFSPDGETTLRACYRAAEDGGRDSVLHLEVSDDGPGISEADIDRIFEDFVSLDSRYERRTGGTGLGLGIVRRLVQRMKGEIRCESAPGQGARFIVRLPVTFAAPGALPARPGASDDGAALPAHDLLVVDDNEINRDLLKAMLERLGQRVTLARSGQEAVAHAQVAPFDAILMDISMPGMNGIQASQAILRGQGPNTGTPIIPVTAHALPKEREEFAAAGMTGFLQKPLNVAALRAALLALAPPDGAQASVPEGEAPARGAGQRPVLNDETTRELLDLLGREKMSERIRMLARQVTEEVPRLVAAETESDLQTQSHAMAGICGMYGADQLHALLRDIETACKLGDSPRARALAGQVPQAWDRTQSAWQELVGG